MVFSFLEDMSPKIKNYFLVLPILNVIVDLIILAVEDSPDPLMSQRSLLVMAHYVLFFLIYRYYTSKTTYRDFSATILIKIFLIYMFLRVVTSTNLVLSFNYYFKMLIGYFAFFLGYRIINKVEWLESYLKVIAFVSFAYVVSNAIVNFLGLGIAYYKTSKVTGGYSGVESLFGLAVFVLATPYIYKFFSKPQKVFALLVSSMTIIYFLLILRRTNILMLAIGAILYMLLSSQKKYALVISVVFFIGGLGAFYLFNDYFLTTLEARQARLEKVDVSTEGRSVENVLVMQRLLESTVDLVFGTGETFNDAGKYGIISGWDMIELQRQLHNDYARIAFGGGMIGLFFLFAIYWALFQRLRIYSRGPNLDPKLRELTTIALVLLFVAFFTGFSSGITSISYRSMLFFYIAGVLKLNYLHRRKNIELSNSESLDSRDGIKFSQTI